MAVGGKVMEQNKLVVFGSKKIRRIGYAEKWYFSVVDIVEALTDSLTPRQYWGKVKQREFIDLQLSPIWILSCLFGFDQFAVWILI